MKLFDKFTRDVRNPRLQKEKIDYVIVVKDGRVSYITWDWWQ